MLVWLTPTKAGNMLINFNVVLLLVNVVTLKHKNLHAAQIEPRTGTSILKSQNYSSLVKSCTFSRDDHPQRPAEIQSELFLVQLNY